MKRSELLKAFAVNAAQLVSKSIDKLIDVFGKPATAFYQTMKSPPAAICFGAGAMAIYLRGVTPLAALVGAVPAITFIAKMADIYNETAPTRQKPVYAKADYETGPAA